MRSTRPSRSMLATTTCVAALVFGACSAGSDTDTAPASAPSPATEPENSDATTTDAIPSTDAPPISTSDTAAPDTEPPSDSSSDSVLTTTTSDPAPTTSTTEPKTLAAPQIDLTTGSLGGVSFGAPADTLIDDFSSSLGAPTFDTDWMPTSPLLPCLGAEQVRGVTWGDLQVQLEQNDDSVTLGGWILGDGQIIGPDLGADTAQGEPTEVSTLDGVRLGSAPSAITTVEPFQTDDSTLIVPAAVATVIALDDAGSISGLSAGRNDCLPPGLSTIPCTAPIPVRQLPDGTRTTDEMITVEADRVTWADGSNTEFGEGTVTQFFDATSTGVIEIAPDAPISAQQGSIDVRVVPIGDPPVGQTNFFVFDSDSDCVRLLVVGPGLDEAALQSYAETLAAALEPDR